MIEFDKIKPVNEREYLIKNVDRE